MRPDGLQPSPHREFPHLRSHRRPSANAEASRVRGAPRHESDGRRGQDHRLCAGGGRGSPDIHGAPRGRLSRGHGAPPDRAPGGRAPSDAARGGDDPPCGGPRRAGAYVHRRGERLLQDLELPRLRTPVAPRRGGHPSRRPRRQRSVREGERSGLRPLEGEDRRALVGAVGRALRPGAPGLAPRVFGHEHEVSGGDLRPPLRRDRPRVSASRERDRPEHRRHRQGLRSPLDPRGAPPRRRRDHVQEQGELLHAPRRPRAGAQAGRRSLPFLPGSTIARSSTSRGRACSTRPAPWNASMAS